MKTQQPFNDRVKILTLPPLLKNQPLSPKSCCLVVRTNVGNKSGQTAPVKVPLLVDTGASYTTLPVQVLNDLGYDTENPIARYEELVTGGGKESGIPIVQISSFSCLGKQMIDFPVLAYTLPKSPNQRYWRGVLGMDFLSHFEAVILLAKARSKRKNEIRLREFLDR